MAVPVSGSQIASGPTRSCTVLEGQISDRERGRAAENEHRSEPTAAVERAIRQHQQRCQPGAWLCAQSDQATNLLVRRRVPPSRWVAPVPPKCKESGWKAMGQRQWLSQWAPPVAASPASTVPNRVPSPGRARGRVSGTHARDQRFAVPRPDASAERRRRGRCSKGGTCLRFGLGALGLQCAGYPRKARVWLRARRLLRADALKCRLALWWAGPPPAARTVPSRPDRPTGPAGRVRQGFVGPLGTRLCGLKARPTNDETGCVRGCSATWRKAVISGSLALDTLERSR